MSTLYISKGNIQSDIMKKQILNILVLFAILALTVMPAMAAGEGERLNITPASNESQNSGTNTPENSEISNSDGFNRLLQAPITGVNTVMEYDPLEKASITTTGLFVGGSIILTVIAFAANNGRISLGSILGNWKAMISGRNMMLWVLLGFCGFLFALAMMKYVATKGIF